MKDLLRRLLGRYAAFRLRRCSRELVPGAEPVLVVAPHADDETLGCGGLLAWRSARDLPSHVAFLSDSAGSPPEPGLAERRRSEALAALAELGVPASHAHFLGAPDGQLDRLPAADAARATTALVALLHATRPADVYVPFLGGGSSEHNGANRLTRAAIGTAATGSRVWEYPVWAWWDARRLLPQLQAPTENFRLPLGEARARKRAALACHSSQLQPAPGQFALPPVLADLCLGPDEFYFQRPRPA